MRLALPLLLAISAPVTAQVLPVPDSLDPRIQTLTLPSDGVGKLTVLTTTGLVLTVLKDERIDTVVLGDPTGFAARVDSDAKQLAIRVLRPDARSTVSVLTTMRAYNFELEANDGQAAASRVRLVPASAAIGSSAGTAAASEPDGAGEITVVYKLSGDRALRPLSVDDDGEVTYIAWADDQALPAVFGVGPAGAEEVTDGNMRDGLWVLDRVWPRLVFRIDRARAEAKRVVRRPR